MPMRRYRGPIRPLDSSERRIKAARSEMAVERVHELADKVLYAPDVPYGPKQAAALAKALRTDKQLKGLLNDPAELDALVDAATKVGGRTAAEATKIRAAIPESLPSRAGGGFGSGTGAAVGVVADVAMGGLPAGPSGWPARRRRTSCGGSPPR
jgi:hypothetical protein